MHFLHATIFFLDKEMKKKYIGKANKEIETPTKNPKNTTTENEISKEYKKKVYELARIRTWNLLIRSQTRYPLRHKPSATLDEQFDLSHITTCSKINE